MSDKKSKQQKPKSKTVKTFKQPKPEEPPIQETKPEEPPIQDTKPEDLVNLCDTCIYEFGQCEVTDIEFSKEAAQDNVVRCGTYTKGEPGPGGKGVNIVGARSSSSPPVPDEPTEELPLLTGYKDEFEPCPSCTFLLKRTAFNKARDTVRCLNRSCRMYRIIVRMINRKPRTLRERGLAGNGQTDVIEAEA